ncbi:MAG: tRNA lysidine(34) synthetase TilS [Bdellovibrio sp.]|nr:MAG: tRNA lysidine(34) synthetase TilS [Bdellovibrio sp.]
MPWTPLSHSIYRWWKQEGLAAARLGLAVSGGADSMALASVFAELRQALRLEVHILHVHHGPGLLRSFRDESLSRVREYSEKEGLCFHAISSSEELHGEKALRDLRRQAMLAWQGELRLDWLATAHHAEDLLETQILRLIRGTGQQGLAAMSMQKKPWLRPFLKHSRHSLRLHLAHRQVRWLEDPSNENPQYLRNWLRHHWLPTLEERVPGAVFRLGQSLETLAARSFSLPFSKGNTIPMSHYLRLSVADRRRLLAHFLHRLKGRDYRFSHIEEIRKRLDNPQVEHIFKVAGVLWQVNAEQILVQKMD